MHVQLSVYNNPRVNFSNCLHSPGLLWANPEKTNSQGLTGTKYYSPKMFLLLRRKPQGKEKALFTTNVICCIIVRLGNNITREKQKAMKPENIERSRCFPFFSS